MVLSSAFIGIISCNAQILPLLTADASVPNNAHIKDLNNELSPYEGIYKSNFEGNETTLYITKIEDKLELRSTKQFYRDALVTKYVVKNSAGFTLQDTKNYSSDIELYSTYHSPSTNNAILYYSGTNCGVGYEDEFLKKINLNQISWEYKPNNFILDDERCPPGTDINVYLPVTKDLIYECKTVSITCSHNLHTVVTNHPAIYATAQDLMAHLQFPTHLQPWLVCETKFNLY